MSLLAGSTARVGRCSCFAGRRRGKNRDLFWGNSAGRRSLYVNPFEFADRSDKFDIGEILKVFYAAFNFMPFTC